MNNKEMTPKKEPNVYVTAVILAAGITAVLGIRKIYRELAEPYLCSEVPELVRNILGQMIVPYVFGLGLCALLYRILPVMDRSGIETERPSAGIIIKGVIIQTGLGFMFAIPLNIAYMIFTGKLSAANNDFGSLYIAFLVLIFSPVVEELLFRKMTIDRLRRFGKYPAVLISAVMFAVPHIFSQSIAAFGMTLAAGFVWGYVYYKTNNLLPCVLMHALFNIINGYAANFLTTNGPVPQLIYVLVYVLAFPVISVVLIVMNRKKIFSVN